MRSLFLVIVLSLAGCHAAPVLCDGHLQPINRSVAAATGVSATPGSSAPASRGSL
jgi:hypothetical protein